MADVKLVRRGGGFAPPKPEAFNGPKKPALGAYFTWCETVRGGIIAEMKEKCAKEGTPFKVTEVASQMAAKYKEVSEEEKEKFKAKSEVVKAKWMEEMEAWKKTPEYQKYLTQKSTAKEKGQLKKARAGVKDAGMPKRPASAYWLYLSSRRDAISADLKAKNAFKIQDISIIGSKEWAELSAEQKAPLEEQAKALKEQYEKDLAAFKLTDAYKEFEKQTDKIKAVKAGEKAMRVKAEKALRKVYIVSDTVNMTEGLDVSSTVIRSLEKKEKLKTVEAPSEHGDALRIKCVAQKDKAEGYVSIREGESNYLTLKPEAKPRKPKASKKKDAEAEEEDDDEEDEDEDEEGDEDEEEEGDEEDEEEEEDEQPKKEGKKRGPKPKVDGEPAAKKPRAMKAASGEEAGNNAPEGDAA